MGQAKTFPGHAVHVVAFQLIARGEGHRVDDDVQAVPVFAQAIEYGTDLFIAAHITRNGDVGTQFIGHFDNTVLKFFVLVGKGQFSAFTVHGLGDPPGN